MYTLFARTSGINRPSGRVIYLPPSAPLAVLRYVVGVCRRPPSPSSWWLMNIQEQDPPPSGAPTATTIARRRSQRSINGAKPAITLVAIYALPVGTGLAEKALVGRHNEYRCVNRT
jgi:hypothetical protein